MTRSLPAALALLALGCTRDTSGLDPARAPAQGVVFTDAFGEGVSFQGFSGSSTAALAIDSTVRRTGIASLRINVPLPTDPAGSYAGGAFVATNARDLSGYDALTFWARASIAASLNVAGLGNDNTGTSRYTAQRADIPLTTEWRKVVIPIPLPARLASERGLFFLAEGAENGAAYQIWLDDVQFERLGTITNPRPALAPLAIEQEVGGVTRLDGLTVTFAVDGTDQVVAAMPSYFTFTSSNTSVATAAADGAVTVVGPGNATITAALGTTPATGTVTVRTIGAPTAAAPAPTRAAADVRSLFSDAYQNAAAVSTWSATWDQADVADVQVGGNAAKKYTNFVFAGIELAQPLDATAMTHLHLDAYVINDDAFKVKLVDFGANGAFGGGDDTEHEVTLGRTTTPALTRETWSSLDIPLSAFTGLAARAHLAQVVLSGSSGTVYLDNVYLYRDPVVVPPSEPTTAAPAPAFAAGDVVSLFSDAYTNRTVDTWSAGWDQADVADVTVAGNAAKRYTNLVFAGIEFTSQQVDATAMTHFHMQIWTPDATTNAAFKIKLVDFGANGAFAGGDDVEHELTLTATSTPGLRTGQWVTLDIPLSQFTGLVTRGHLAQLIISGDPKTVFVDNVLLHR